LSPSIKSEREILKSVGARPHPNSGRNTIKADGSDDMFVIDVKEASKSFTLNDRVWTKICSDSYQVDPYKSPQLLIVLGGTKRLAIIESDILQELQEAKRTLDKLDNP
jgi:hypothetical protein